MLNVESVDELKTVNDISLKRGEKAPVSIRINPDIDSGTHPYISTGFKTHKFGVSESEAGYIMGNLNNFSGVDIIGVSCHIGSQILSLKPFSDAIERLLRFLSSMSLRVSYIDAGGGAGICYKDENPPAISDYVKLLEKKIKGHSGSLIIEPGRSIVGNAGVLLGKVHYIKANDIKKFYVTDIGMNDIIRPSLYGAYHSVLPCRETSESEKVDLVGPVCESGDVIFMDRNILKVAAGDFLVVKSAGAYCFSMSSNYNSRPRACEILVDGDTYTVIRKRETYDDLIRYEIDL